MAGAAGPKIPVAGCAPKGLAAGAAPKSPGDGLDDAAGLAKPAKVAAADGAAQECVPCVYIAIS